MTWRRMVHRDAGAGDGGGTGGTGGTGDGTGAGGAGGSKLTVVVDGKSVEIDRPAGWLTEAEFSARFAKELGRRTSALSDKAVEKFTETLRKDENARAGFLASLGIQTGEPGAGDGGAGTNPKAAAALRKELEAEFGKQHVEPLKGKLAATESRLGKLTERVLVSEITRAAAELGVRKAYLKPTVSGGLPPIVAMFRDTFAYDTETESWYVRKGDGFAFSAKPDDGAPYKTVAEFFGDLAGSKEHADFFEAGGGQTGPGARTGGMGGNGRGGEVRITRADASIKSKYDAAEKRATETGGRLVIVDN